MGENNKKQIKDADKMNKSKSVIWEYVEAIIIAIILAFIIRKFVIQAYKIPSGSMLETLQIGDHILVNKFIYNFKEPKRGDVIVFKYPEDKKRDFIKRVVGLPGDRFEIQDKKIYINGNQLDEPYVVYKDMQNLYKKIHPAFFKNNKYIIDRDNYSIRIIPKDKYFMMGDNRDFSQDSRFWDLLDKDLIEGKALIIYWSWNGDSKGILNKVRWGRIGKLLH